MIHQSMKVLLLLSAMAHAGDAFPNTEASVNETSTDITAGGIKENICSSDDNKLTDEVLFVRASSASVLQWFSYIEKQKGISISFNQAIDMERRCTVRQSATMSVAQLLDIILKDYRYSITEMPGRKIAIRIDAKREFSVSGTIADESTSEKLYGAIIMASGTDGRKIYSTSDENGNYRLNLTEGEYTIEISYMGYEKFSTPLHLYSRKRLDMNLKPALFEVDEVTVRSIRNDAELAEITPSGMLSFSGNDLFSQIWILPGVTGTPTGNNFMVDGGSYDENIILLDGVPVFHPGHVNALLPQFNGDVIKNIVFHKGFFPTRLEGGLSSVTEFNLKDGNKNRHTRTFSIDMPAASLTLEGPIIKNKLSYLVSVRRSWMDFFDELLSEENRLNHYSFDYTAKLSYYMSENSSLKFFAYNTFDEFRFPLYTEEAIPVVKWNNQIYKATYNGMWGKLGNTTSAYYSSHMSRANADVLGFGLGDDFEDDMDPDSGWEDNWNDDWNNGDSFNQTENNASNNEISNGIKTINFNTEFTYSPENIYSTRWGFKYSHEMYEMTAFGENIKKQNEAINQYSLYYDNYIRVTNNLTTRVGVHFIAYNPVNFRNYYSIQPRFALNFTPGKNDLIYLNFSKMEQFYHYISFNGISLPTDFRMPSIEGFKPRSSEHYEIGWKKNFDSDRGKLETSAYYKTRRNIVALKPDAIVENDNWNNYIMVGNGDSYGIKMFLYYMYRRWTMQLSYTYSRSREWFDEYKSLGKLPSLYDMPHYGAGALSYKISKSSSLSIGCITKSGRIKTSDNWFESDKDLGFRQRRGEFNYRIDVGYTFKKDFGDKLLLLRCGLYNLLGNPPEEDIVDFYSVHLSENCLPYGSLSFKF